MSLPKLGRYELIRVLGKGAMGLVYEARDPNLERRVALKTIKVDSLSPGDAADYEVRFRVEAQSAARLQHPNIVSVYDSDRDQDVAFLVMEFVQGDDLKHHLDHGRQYTLTQTLGIMADLLAALDYAHRQGIVHRDIKPANLLVEAGGKVKLTDFGVARMQDSGDVTRTRGAMVGTLKYMAPEQVKGQRVDSRADLFSAGIVLHQLLTGKRPFDGETDFAVIQQIIRNNPAAPSYFNPELPPALDAVVAKALAKSRDDRYATAAEFAEALQLAGQQAGDPNSMPPPATPSSGRTGSTWSATVRPGESLLGTDLGSPATAPAVAATVTQELELVYWKDVKDSAEAQEIQVFLDKFPSGIYADLARRRLRKLSGVHSDQTNTGLWTTPSGPELHAQSAVPAAQASAAATGSDDRTAILPAEQVTIANANANANANAPAPAPALASEAAVHDGAAPLPADAPKAGSDAAAEAEKIKKALAALRKQSASRDAKTATRPAKPGAATQPLIQDGAAPITAAAGGGADVPAGKPTNGAASTSSVGKLDGDRPADRQRIKKTMHSRGGAAEADTDTETQTSSSRSVWALAGLGLLAITGLVFAFWPAAQTERIASTAQPVAIVEPTPPVVAAANIEAPAILPDAAVATGTATSSEAQQAAGAAQGSTVPDVLPSTPAGAQRDKATPGAAQAAVANGKRKPTALAKAAAAKAEKVQVAPEPENRPVETVTAAPPPPAPAPPAPSAPPSPGKVCDGRSLIAYQLCMSEQCAKPAYAKHSLCVERRNLERRSSTLNDLGH